MSAGAQAAGGEQAPAPDEGSASLEGRVGIVTGAGRGIGRALALALARQGAALVVNDVGAAVDGTPDTRAPGGPDRAPEAVANSRPSALAPASSQAMAPAAALASEITEQGGSALANRDSVVSWDAARGMVAQAVDTFGRLDFVVNNAGIVRDAIFHKMSEDAWDQVLAVHLKGTFNLCRAAAERFRSQGSGAIVNMTSTSGLIGNYGQANYATAKLGIVGLTRAIALDMRRFGVRANAVAPFAWTRMTQTIPDGADKQQQARVEALKKLRPEQIAPLVVFLVSDAAQAISGQVFAVRGAEIVLFSLPRPSRSFHRSGGWTTEGLAEVLPDALQGTAVPLEVTADVFNYDPLL